MEILIPSNPPATFVKHSDAWQWTITKQSFDCRWTLSEKTRRGWSNKYVGKEPAAASIEEQGLGWKNTSGKETLVIQLPADSNLPGQVRRQNGAIIFRKPFGYEWGTTKSPAGAQQWKPKGNAGAGLIPDAHDPSKHHQPMMLTTDLALRMDPAYEKISRHFYENRMNSQTRLLVPGSKLTHRDMGPRSLSRKRSSIGGIDLARSCSRSKSPAYRRQRHQRIEK